MSPVRLRVTYTKTSVCSFLLQELEEGRGWRRDRVMEGERKRRGAQEGEMGRGEERERKRERERRQVEPSCNSFPEVAAE